MSRKTTKEVVTVAFLLTVVAISTGVSADSEGESTDAVAQVTVIFENNDIFAHLESLSAATSEVVVSDDVFADISGATFSSLTGEEFVVDYEKGDEVSDFWNYEYGNSPNWEYQLLYNDDRAILRNITKTFSQGKEEVVGEEQILANAQADLETLGLAVNDEDFEIQVEYLARMSFDKYNNGMSEYVAYRVFVYRKIGGAYVRGARVLLGYYLDGTLQKVSMKWPRIQKQQLQMGPLTSTDETKLIEEAAAILPDVPSMKKKMDAVHAEVALEVRDELLKGVVVFRPPDDLDNVGPLEEIVIDL